MCHLGDLIDALDSRVKVRLLVIGEDYTDTTNGRKQIIIVRITRVREGTRCGRRFVGWITWIMGDVMVRCAERRTEIR